MTALPKSKVSERRTYRRYSIVGQLPVMLIRNGSEKIRVFVQDISRDGIGIVASLPVKPREKLQLTWTDQHWDPVEMTVIWKKEIEDESGTLYYCGLHHKDPEVDLEARARSYEHLSLDELD